MPGNGYQGECGRWGWTQGEGHKKKQRRPSFSGEKEAKGLVEFVAFKCKSFLLLF
jgi:hypothetical protein